MRHSNLRRTAVVAVLAQALLLTACSSAVPTEGEGGTVMGAISTSPAAQDADPTATDTAAAQVPPADSPQPDGTPPQVPAATGTPSGPTADARPDQRPAANAPGWQDAAIFTSSEDRIGITDSTVKVCMHAALVAGDVFGNTPEDYGVYWQWRNANGGIHGRMVESFVTDDQYTPQGGVQAAEQCKQKGAFVITGGVGFDTVPAVREWAEQNRSLYLASFATERGLGKLRHSFGLQASVEQFGAVSARLATKRYPSKIGVIWRNSPNWQGGRDAFVREVKAAGGTVVADVPVQQNQGEYLSAILKLRDAGAESVLAWVNVLEFAQLVKQAASQNYRPRWMTATFNLVTDTLGEDVDGRRGPPMVGLWVTPTYRHGDRGGPYDAEMALMEAAYKKYRPNKKTLNDVDWQVWLGNRQLARILEDCGRQCTRNRLAGMLAAGYKQDQPPMCPLDFARGGGRLGAFLFNAAEAEFKGGISRWRQTALCTERF